MVKKLLIVFLCSLLLVGCGSNSAPTATSVPEEAASALASLLGESDNTATETSKANTNTNTVVDNRTKTGSSSAAASTKTQDAAFTADDFDSQIYFYESTFSTQCYVVVKNNSQATVEIGCNATALDASGSVLGAGRGSIDVLGPDEESIMPVYFSDVSNVEQIEYQLNFSPARYYQPVVGNLVLQQTINNNNLTVSVTNNGSINAQFVEAYALFFDADDNLVYTDYTYVTDNDSEIKPGASISAQLDCRESFDHVLCFLAGRSDGSASEVADSSLDDQFEKAVHIYETRYASYVYLIYTNNSDKTMEIKANITAYDTGNNVIGASDASIDVLGPGETSIAQAFFNGVSDIDHIDYTSSYTEARYYKPVIADLSITQNINNNNVVVTVENNGSMPAQFVEVHALFFDSNGVPVNHDYAYAVDNDSEIKPGASISVQLDCRSAFDTVECYLTGRAH